MKIIPDDSLVPPMEIRFSLLCRAPNGAEVEILSDVSEDRLRGRTVSEVGTSLQRLTYDGFKEAIRSLSVPSD